MKETTNGNKVFSDEKNKKETLDFQTEHMKNKIKNVKKRKKMLNIQNIEPLVNIHEIPEEGTKEPIIEGLNLNPIVTFNDDEWTGNDKIYEGGNKRNYKSKSFAETIEDIYRKITEKYDKFAYNLTKLFSADTFHEEDVKHIKKYMNWFLSIIVASIAVYNWVFLMFFNYEDGSKVKVWKTPRDYISNSGSLNPFFRILDKFTNIPLFFPEYLKKILIEWFPSVITTNIDKDGITRIVLILIFMGMLGLFTFLANNSGEMIKNVLVDIAKFDFDGPLTIFIYFVTMILFVMSFMETNPIAAILPLGSFLSFFKYTNPLFWLEKIIILVYLIFLGVPIATSLCLMYILSYTFFGIPLYKSDNSISEIKTLIDNFLENYKPKPRKDTPCNPLSFLETIINYTVKIFNYIYDNCIQLGFVVVMLYALIDSGINIKSNNLKLVTMMISIATMLLVAAYSILSFIKGDTQDESSESELNKEQSNDTPIQMNPIHMMDAIKENIKLEPDVKENITNIAENININDNEKLKEGLQKGVDMLSNIMKK